MATDVGSSDAYTPTHTPTHRHTIERLPPSLLPTVKGPGVCVCVCVCACVCVTTFRRAGPLLQRCHFQSNCNPAMTSRHPRPINSNSIPIQFQFNSIRFTCTAETDVSEGVASDQRVVVVVVVAAAAVVVVAAAAQLRFAGDVTGG